MLHLAVTWGGGEVIPLVTNTIHIYILCVINKVPKKCLPYENCDRLSDLELGYSKDFHTGILLCETRDSTHESHISHNVAPKPSGNVWLPETGIFFDRDIIYVEPSGVGVALKMSSF